jgi:hypothetical protein
MVMGCAVLRVPRQHPGGCRGEVTGEHDDGGVEPLEFGDSVLRRQRPGGLGVESSAALGFRSEDGRRALGDSVEI